MKISKKNKPKPTLLQRLFKWWFLILFLGLVLYFGGKQTIINFRLKNHGKCAKAIVYSRNKIGGKGTVDTKYSFVWKNYTYNGSSTSDDKYRDSEKFFLTENDLITGDTIMIVFLESNPEINRSNSIVKKNCDCLK